MNKKVFLDVIWGETALGRIEIELWSDITPKTAENFRGLCSGEYGNGKIYNKKLTYKGSRIHRIVEGQYFEGGDIVYGNGKGGESIYGEFFNDENFIRKHSCAGLLSMSNHGRNSNSSQFLITLKTCPQLNGKNVVFGQVTSGMEVVYQIGKIPTDTNQRPKNKVIIYECGDYDISRLHLREDVFKETIQSILEERAEKEKVKILGPEEAENFRKQKRKSVYNKEQHYSGDEGSEQKNKECSSNEEDEDDDSKEEEEENNNALLTTINKCPNKEDLMKKYYLMKAKITEANNLNNKAVIDENEELNDIDKEHKLARQEWINKRDNLNQKLVEQGIPQNKLYSLDSINRCELKKNKIKQKEKNESFGWDVFNVEAYYRANKKRLRDMPFDKALYDEQMEKGVDMTKVDTDERKKLLVNDIDKQMTKRSQFSRRRAFFEERTVDYINERNRKFNEKLDRFFGKESAEIKANLERGTSL